MDAIWSFWTKPYLASRYASWRCELDHWLAWGLSLRLAARHYSHTWLYTDDYGARTLIDDLRLPFAHVSTALNCLRDVDPGWWAMGKLEAYRRHDQPFVHIDTDVFLWNRLPARMEKAPVFAQNPEPIDYGNSCYRPQAVEEAIGWPNAGWLPREWAAARPDTAACCGVFGGSCVEFIQQYAEAARRILSHRQNREGMGTIQRKDGHMILLEQYLITAFVAYHRERAHYPGIRIEYLFESLDEAYSAEHATLLGFTHLASEAKRSLRIAHDLEHRMRVEDPAYYARCLEYSEG